VSILTLQEIASSLLGNCGFWTAVVFVALTLIEITPIKINPWSWFGKIVGKAFTGEVMKEIGTLKKDMASLGQDIGHVKEEVKGIKQDVSDIREEAKEREATNRRARILEFGDEILHEVDYSKEHWDNILMDISAYEHYCDEHPRYMNNVAKATIKHIKKIYQKHLETDSFL
jgi:hypothetical protein